MYECTCKKGECDRVTGECICPDGWYGLECQNGKLFTGNINVIEFTIIVIERFMSCPYYFRRKRGKTDE